MVTTKRHSPAYLWVKLSPMEQVIWGGAYAMAKGAPAARARVADRTVQSLHGLKKRRDSLRGPEYEAARCNVILDPPEFEAWYRVQARIVIGPAAKKLSKEDYADAYERYRMGLGDFY